MEETEESAKKKVMTLNSKKRLPVMRAILRKKPEGELFALCKPVLTGVHLSNEDYAARWRKEYNIEYKGQNRSFEAKAGK